jgi:Cu2+-exporting ATPase
MKTSVIEVRDMLSVLSVLGVEERIGKVPGVESVTVNFAAGNATVRFDETRLNLADIKSDVRQNGFEADAGAGDAAAGDHEHKSTPGTPAGDPEPAPPKTPPAAAAASEAPPAGGASPVKVDAAEKPSATAEPPPAAAEAAPEKA